MHHEKHSAAIVESQISWPMSFRSWKCTWLRSKTMAQLMNPILLGKVLGKMQCIWWLSSYTPLLGYLCRMVWANSHIVWALRWRLRLRQIFKSIGALFTITKIRMDRCGFTKLKWELNPFLWLEVQQGLSFDV